MHAPAFRLATILAVIACTGCDPQRSAIVEGDEAQPPAPSRPADAPSAATADVPPIRPNLALSGEHLVDASGASVYAIVDDPLGTGCDATCEAAWPPVLFDEQTPMAASGLQPGLLTAQTREDGSRQLVYAGYALYRYAGDSGAGSTSGSGVEDRWGEWRLLSSSGRPLPPKHEDSAADRAAQPGDGDAP